jgi:hypothetical protein
MQDVYALQIHSEHLQRERLAEAARERLISAAVDRVGLRVALGAFLINAWASTRHQRAARESAEVALVVQEA